MFGVRVGYPALFDAFPRPLWLDHANVELSGFPLVQVAFGGTAVGIKNNADKSDAKRRADR